MPDDDSDFLRQFEECSWPFEKWTHRAHVKVAFLYLRQHPFEEAMRRMRDGIKRYNGANKVPESQTSG